MTAFNFFTILLYFSFLSCNQDISQESIDQATTPKIFSKDGVSNKKTYENRVGKLPESFIHDFKIFSLFEGTSCGITELSQQFRVESMAIRNDSYNGVSEIGFSIINLMWDINYFHSLYDHSNQYYGASGEYTNYVNNRVRSLEKFWGLEDKIQVKGQHNATLNDKDAIIFALENGKPWGRIPAFIYDYPLELWADYIIENNKKSEVLSESPLVSSDGFAWTLGGGLSGIVIGDGLIELVSSVGTDEKIGWTTVLSHEWAHQVQFQYDYIGYWKGLFNNDSEVTRAIELEADFIASYYMTHKRGATYNMKRIEQYLENFFQIGDCSFTSSSHHGTPDQRRKASNLGDNLAQSAHKKGEILSAEEVHKVFVNAFPELVALPKLIKP